MGDPKKTRKKYSTPTHPWQRERIEYEAELRKEYGLRSKKEIWLADSYLKKITNQVKKLIREKTEQARKEEKEFLDRLVKFKLIEKTAKIEDVLNLTTKDILGRRLQTLVFKKKLARTANQARQFIIHGHIFIGDKKVSKPSYFVNIKEEVMINFNPLSSLAKEGHPERIKEENEKVVKETGKKEKPVKEKKSENKKVKTKDKKKVDKKVEDRKEDDK